MTIFVPQVAVVDFHHARGPEIEFWVTPEGRALCNRNDWSLLPFMALTDGSHAAIEGISYFTLLNRTDDGRPHSSLFGIACTRQIAARRLKVKSEEVTRSTVQKAIVIVTDTPGRFAEIRENLSALTNAWFAQEDFTDISILKDLQEVLAALSTSQKDEQEQYFGLSLRELVYEFRHQTLVLVKCLLLERKMLFFGTNCERLCMMQFALISLIPGLIRNLQDCADPALDTHANAVSRATSLRTSERSSLLAYMGLPLQLFGKGAFFGPYTPLQQLDILADYETKSYVVGSTNSLLLQQKDRYSDIIINLDESNSVTIASPSLRTALILSAADRRWIDHLTQVVVETWDPLNPSQPKGHGYAGSEDAIRLQFEEYLLSLLSSAAYQIYQFDSMSTLSPAHPPASSQTSLPDPVETAGDFNMDFLSLWRQSNNFAVFRSLTSGNRIFDITEPRHPTAGGLNVEDVQRRLAQSVAELHLDQRVKEGREQLGKTVAQSRERVGAWGARVWRDWETYREGRRSGSQTRDPTGIEKDVVGASDQRTPRDAAAMENVAMAQSLDDAKHTSQLDAPSTSTSMSTSTTWQALRDRASKIQTPQLQRPAVVDTAQLQAVARDNAAKASAYLSSWGTWAKKRGEEWQQGSRKTGTEGTEGARGNERTKGIGKGDVDVDETAEARASREYQRR